MFNNCSRHTVKIFVIIVGLNFSLSIGFKQGWKRNGFVRPNLFTHVFKNVSSSAMIFLDSNICNYFFKLILL